MRNGVAGSLLFGLGLLFACTVCCFTKTLDSPWPVYRHDYAHTGRAGYPGPGVRPSVIWTRQVGTGSSPVVGNGVIYVLADGNLYAFSLSGESLWSYPCGSGKSTPALASDGTIYAAASTWLYAINSDGSLKWKKTIGAATDASPTIGPDGTVYIGSSQGKLYVYYPDGSSRTNFPVSVSSSAINSSAAVGSDGTVYFGCDDSKIYAVSADGRSIWSATPGNGIIKSSPSISADETRVYFGSNAGRFCYVLVSPSGSKTLGSAASGSSISSPAIGADSSVYLGCLDGKLYSYAKSGALKWSMALGVIADSSPAIDSNGLLFIGSGNGNLYAINPGVSSGSVVWSLSIDGSAVSSPAIGDSRLLFVMTANGNLACLGADNTPPPAPAVTDDGVFSSQLSTLHASWTCSDPESGIAKYEYAIGTSPGAEDILPYTSAGTATEVTRTGLPLVDGGTYYFSIRATNGVGLVGETGFSDGIRTDFTPPSIPLVHDDGAYSIEQSKLHTSWSASDLQSGIARYEYAIGTSPAIQDIVAFTDAGINTEITRADLSLVNGKTYYFFVRAINEAGLMSETGISDGIKLDFTCPQAPVVTDDGAYTTNNTTLHATWTCSDPESGIARYEYAIGTLPGAEDIAAFTDIGTATEVTRSGLALTNGATCYFSVRAENAAGLESSIGVSNGIMVDITPPAAPVIIDDGAYTADANNLHFVYASGDTESGVAYYEYSIGSASGLTDILDWKNAGLIKEQTVTGLSLSHGVTYYINVRAYNRAGLMSHGSSNGILVDLTPPPIPSIAVTSVGLTQIRFTVTGSDSESGIAGIQYALLTSPDIPASVQWTDAASGIEIMLSGSFDPAKKYYIAARACNKVGLWGNPGVAPVAIDQTPPSTPVVTDDGVYWPDPTSLHATWVAQDSESGITRYSYCVGTGVGLSDIVSWTDTTGTDVTLTDLLLTDGKCYYFSVKAVNGAGIEGPAGYSNGITVDSTAPSQPIVTDDGDYTTSTESLHAAYSATDLQSGIVEYIYCIGTSAGAADVVAWTSSGTSGSITVSGLTLSTGVRYYFSVKARNGAGKWSAVGSSDGIEVKPVLATWPKFRFDAENSGRCEVSACVTGHLNWRVQTQGYVESSAAMGGDGTAYIGSSDGSLYAVASNGNVRWSYKTGGGIDSSPAIGAYGEIYFGSYDQYLYCLQPSGTLEWKYRAEGMIWSSPVVASDGVIYFGCQDGYFYALKPDGSLKWRYQAGAAVWSSPAIGSDGTIYFACGDGKLYAVTSEGSLKWTYQTGTAADSSPAFTDGVIYFGSGDGYFYAINADGTLRWKLWTGNLVDSSAAIASDGTIYVGTGGAGTSGTLRAISSSGTQLWCLNITGGVRSSPAIDANGNIYVGTAGGEIRAIKPDGSTLWTYNIGQSVLSSPAIGGEGQVVVGSDDGCIYCFKDITDTTPPSVPVVTPVNNFVEQGSALACKWSSTDPESGIAGYSYCIGTQPGASDVAAWVSAGSATSVSRADILLTIGQSYYFGVKARNHASLESGVGVSSAIIVISGDPANTIGQAKQRPEGTRVYLPGKIVTGVFADSIFIEEPDRSAGIRCIVASSDLEAKAVVDVIGKITEQNDEVVITDAMLTRNAIASDIAPLALSTKALAGTGLDAKGLLVRVAGRVTRVGAYYFLISDGASIISPRGASGIEVRIDSGSIPAVGSFIAVTGIACREIVNGTAVIVIKAVGAPTIMGF